MHLGGKGFGGNKWILINCGVFALCVGAGLIAGQMLRGNNKWSYAASSNITVTDNNQIVTAEQSMSNSTITRTSTVTVADGTAEHGYVLTARVVQNTIPGSTVKISSGDSAICAPASPCTLSAAAGNILETDGDEATAPGGETTEWTVNITLPANTPLGNYIVDLEYDEDAIVALLPPPGVDPGVFSPTNQAVLDVYPTTGWAGDVVAITGNAIFTDVRSVAIGDIACTNYTVISTSLIACELPAQASGATKDIVVMNGAAPGTNVTNASTYTHMKITYFDPGQNTVTISTTDTDGSPFTATYTYYAHGFTSPGCSSLIASNSTSMNIPASIAFVRDIRNNQVYKVKRMIDDKCWMIDNLKYIDDSIANVDSTVGMVYNNTSGEYNTVDGTSTRSTPNSDKAFYNNPMSVANCYGGSTSYMASNTLTHCGYLYNWYAATGGTGTYSMVTVGDQASGSICPANFRLPSAWSGTGGPTTNGTSYTVADFPVLNASMNAGSLASGVTTSYPTNWRSSGAWSGTFSGNWATDLINQGASGNFWSSTIDPPGSARYLYIASLSVISGNGSTQAYRGSGVRCVLP